jgi:hypothetical protein
VRLAPGRVGLRRFRRAMRPAQPVYRRHPERLYPWHLRRDLIPQVYGEGVRALPISWSRFCTKPRRFMKRMLTDISKPVTPASVVTRRIACREIALRSGLVSLSFLSRGMSAAAGPSAACKVYCKKKDRQKSRRRCNARCDRAAARCRANPDCVAEQVCGHERCMTVCTVDAECQPGSHCQNGACVRI